ncbi:FAD binding domain-containing protein [Aspergillus floccosus]
MASTLAPKTWEAGYARLADQASWEAVSNYVTESGERAHWTLPVQTEPPTSTTGNDLGVTHLRTWPSIYDGTATGRPEWFKSSTEVDVLICGAGPFGLELGLILARQGISFRIVDKADAPCLSGRADGVHPRALELLHAWGLAHEVSEEGPILNSTVLFRNGVKLFHGFSSTCDSRYKGIHIITQGQMERIYIRDLLRHRIVVERGTTVRTFDVQATSQDPPVHATLKNVATGVEEVVRARYLIGADGAASSIRKQLGAEFDGITTDIYWAIMDCRFKTDYPHILGFNIIIRAEHGGCIVIPREDGYTRFYTQINGEKARKLQANRQARRNASTVGETRIDDHGITPDEVLEQLNKIIAPHKVEFASPMSWFSVWRVSERVARQFSSSDLRVHLGGDAAVLGAFGLNSSIYDAANLGWKLGLVLRKHAQPSILTNYDSERRLFANRVIRCSGAYLRFICNSSLPLAALRDLGEHLESHDKNLPPLDGSTEADRDFLYTFFKRHAMFLLGVEWPVVNSAICPTDTDVRASSLRNGVRAPNPRVCLDANYTAYLYDKMMGVGRFHLLLFASDLQGPVRQSLAVLAGEIRKRGGFYKRFGGREMFNLILVVKTLPYQTPGLLDGDLAPLEDQATIVYDDRAPDEDAHYWYGVNHARGALVVVRPDLAVGVSAWPEEISKLNKYFAMFLLESEKVVPPKKGLLARLWDAL